MATNHILACAILGILMAYPSFAENEVWTDFSVTDYIFKWQGEFIGSLHFDIPVEIDGWNMTLTFPKNIYNFEICPAEVLEIEDRRIVHLTSHPWNSHIEENGVLSMWFNARTWRRLKGIRGTVELSANIVPGRNETTNGTESESESSRSDLSSEGMDNGLTCTADVSNVTCGSSIEIIATGSVNTVMMEIPINFNLVEPEEILIYSDTRVIFATTPTFNHRFVSLDGEEEVSIPTPQTQTDSADKRFMMMRLINLPMQLLQEGGRGHLIVQISYGVNGGANTGGLIFPYIQDTPKCLCSRLKITDTSS